MACAGFWILTNLKVLEGSEKSSRRHKPLLVTDVYNKYNVYCSNENVTPVTLDKFEELVETLLRVESQNGFIARENVRVYRHLMFKNPSDEARMILPSGDASLSDALGYLGEEVPLTVLKIDKTSAEALIKTVHSVNNMNMFLHVTLLAPNSITITVCGKTIDLQKYGFLSKFPWTKQNLTCFGKLIKSLRFCEGRNSSDAEELKVSQNIIVEDWAGRHIVRSRRCWRTLTGSSTATWCDKCESLIRAKPTSHRRKQRGQKVPCTAGLDSDVEVKKSKTDEAPVKIKLLDIELPLQLLEYCIPRSTGSYQHTGDKSGSSDVTDVRTTSSGVTEMNDIKEVETPFEHITKLKAIMEDNGGAGKGNLPNLVTNDQLQCKIQSVQLPNVEGKGNQKQKFTSTDKEGCSQKSKLTKGIPGAEVRASKSISGGQVSASRHIDYKDDVESQKHSNFVIGQNHDNNMEIQDFTIKVESNLERNEEKICDNLNVVRTKGSLTQVKTAGVKKSLKQKVKLEKILCKLCRASFTRMLGLQRHLIKKHELVWVDYINEHCIGENMPKIVFKNGSKALEEAEVTLETTSEKTPLDQPSQIPEGTTAPEAMEEISSNTAELSDTVEKSGECIEESEKNNENLTKTETVTDIKPVGRLSTVASLNCPKCHLSYTNRKTILKHVQANHQMCVDYAKILLDLDNIMYENLKMEPSSAAGMISKCPFCSVEREGQNIFRHLEICHNAAKNYFQVYEETVIKYGVSLQKARKQRKRDYECKKRKNGIIYSCKYCKREFSHRPARSNHENYRCKMNSSKRKLFECYKCGFSTANEESYKRHKETHVGDAREGNACDLCSKAYQTRAGLIIHRRKVHSVFSKRPIIYLSCDQCDKKFYDKDHLNKHKASHSDARPYQCELCGERYKTDAAVTKHQKMVHYNRYRYKCEKCGHGVEKAIYLNKHVCGRVRRVQDQENAPQRTYTMPRKPKRHAKVHTNLEEGIERAVGDSPQEFPKFEVVQVYTDIPQQEGLPVVGSSSVAMVTSGAPVSQASLTMQELVDSMITATDKISENSIGNYSVHYDQPTVTGVPSFTAGTNMPHVQGQLMHKFVTPSSLQSVECGSQDPPVLFLNSDTVESKEPEKPGMIGLIQLENLRVPNEPVPNSGRTLEEKRSTGQLEVVQEMEQPVGAVYSMKALGQQQSVEQSQIEQREAVYNMEQQHSVEPSSSIHIKQLGAVQQMQQLGIMQTVTSNTEHNREQRVATQLVEEPNKMQNLRQMVAVQSMKQPGFSDTGQNSSNTMGAQEGATILLAQQSGLSTIPNTVPSNTDYNNSVDLISVPIDYLRLLSQPSGSGGLTWSTALKDESRTLLYAVPPVVASGTNTMTQLPPVSLPPITLAALSENHTLGNQGAQSTQLTSITMATSMRNVEVPNLVSHFSMATSYQNILSSLRSPTDITMATTYTQQAPITMATPVAILPNSTSFNSTATSGLPSSELNLVTSVPVHSTKSSILSHPLQYNN